MTARLTEEKPEAAPVFVFYVSPLKWVVEETLSGLPIAIEDPDVSPKWRTTTWRLDSATLRLTLDTVFYGGEESSSGERGIEFYVDKGAARRFAGIVLREAPGGPIVIKILADTPSQWLIPENGDDIVVGADTHIDFRRKAWADPSFKRKIWELEGDFHL